MNVSTGLHYAIQLLKYLPVVFKALAMAVHYTLVGLGLLFNVISWISHYTIVGLGLLFDVISWISHPVAILIDWFMWALSPHWFYEKVSLYSVSFFSYTTVWALSLLFIVIGSLIIATEERVPNRNRYRPKTTVPLACLLIGTLMHYDTVRFSSWMPSGVFLTGALWYCISIIHEDTVSRTRRSNLQAWQEARYNVNNVNVATAFRHMRDQSRLYRKKRETEKEKLIPSKLNRNSETGVLEMVDSGLCIIQEEACPICLVDFEHDEVLRVLPCCKHTFHDTCVESWLKIKNHCPLCRANMSDTNQNTWGYLVHALFE